MGFEPTCHQLPFLHGISMRGYIPVNLVGPYNKNYIMNHQKTNPQKMNIGNQE
jgi:hypothetical protein